MSNYPSNITMPNFDLKTSLLVPTDIVKSTRSRRSLLKVVTRIPTISSLLGDKLSASSLEMTPPVDVGRCRSGFRSVSDRRYGALEPPWRCSLVMRFGLRADSGVSSAKRLERDIKVVMQLSQCRNAQSSFC